MLQHLHGSWTKYFAHVRVVCAESVWVFVCQLQLYARLITTVDSKNFVSQLKSLHQASADGTIVEFPFKEATGVSIYLFHSCSLFNFIGSYS